MRPRSYEVRPFPSDRRVVLAGMRAGRRQQPVHGLTSVDVSVAVRRLKEAAPPLSLTAYVVSAVARAVALHPEVAAFRDWRGRLVVPRHVDVATMVEVEGPDGKFPLAHVLRDADARSVSSLSEELTAVKHDPAASESGRLLTRSTARLLRFPGLLRLGYVLLARFPRARDRSGTVTVTSVGMFMGGSGFAIGVPTIMTLTVLVGGMGNRPVVVDGEIVVRRTLDLTISVDHRIVDGGPVARFAADLQRIIETAEPFD